MCALVAYVCVLLLCSVTPSVLSAALTSDSRGVRDLVNVNSTSEVIVQDVSHVHRIKVEEVDRFGNVTHTEMEVVDDESREIRDDKERRDEQEREFREEMELKKMGRKTRRRCLKFKKGKARARCLKRKLRTRFGSWKKLAARTAATPAVDVIRIREDKTIIMPDVYR